MQKSNSERLACRAAKKAAFIVSVFGSGLIFLTSAVGVAHVALNDGSGFYIDYECVRTQNSLEKYPVEVKLLSREEDLIPRFLDDSSQVIQLQLLKEKGVKGSITLVPQRKPDIGDFAVLLPNKNPEVASIIAGPRSDLWKVYTCKSVDVEGGEVPTR